MVITNSYLLEKTIEFLKDDNRAISIYLKGSYANRSNDMFSDIDIGIIVKNGYLNVLEEDIVELFNSITNSNVLMWCPDRINNDVRKIFNILIKTDNCILHFDITLEANSIAKEILANQIIFREYPL